MIKTLNIYFFLKKNHLGSAVLGLAGILYLVPSIVWFLDFSITIDSFANSKKSGIASLNKNYFYLFLWYFSYTTDFCSILSKIYLFHKKKKLFIFSIISSKWLQKLYHILSINLLSLPFSFSWFKIFKSFFIRRDSPWD